MEQQTARIALAGNPNVGKSTVFNALTGMRQHTGNWSGKTVGCASGEFTADGQHAAITDLPGTYSLYSRTGEEAAAGEYLQQAEANLCVVVCDATALERNLPLVLQIREAAPRTLVCLNLMDEARRRGITVDTELLAKRLRVPVIAICARRRRDIARLKEAMLAALAEPEREPAAEAAETRADAEMLYREAAEIAAEAVRSGDITDTRERRLDRLLTGRWTAFPVMLGFLFLLFWLTIAGTNGISARLSALFTAVEAPLYGLLSGIGIPEFVCEMLVYGVVRVTGWVISVMLPPMAIFFPLFTLLEDAGYLPRIAYNLDRCFARCRTCGKQALTMCMGFGCNAAGVVGCRIIDSPRERMIAVLTNAFVPCNGRFPLLITLSSLFLLGGGHGAAGSALFLAGVVVFSVGMTLAVSSFLSRTILRGLPSSFVLELPPYRRPVVHAVLWRSLWERTVFVLGRAAAVAAPAGFLIWILANVQAGDASLYAHLTRFLDPLGRFLGMDGVILLAFVLGFPANETVIPLIMMGYLSAGTLAETGSLTELRLLLTANGWSPLTAVCVMLFSLLHWPCSTTLWTIYRETHSVRWTLLAFALPTACGAVLCAAVTWIVRIFI